MDLQKLCETYERIIQISFFERSSKDEMLIDAIESKRGVIMVKYNQLKIKGETQTLTTEEQLQLEQYGEFIERTFAAEFRTMDTMEICDLINSSARAIINYPASQIIEKTSISVAWKKIEDELKYDLDNKIYVYVGDDGTGTYTPQQIRLIKIFQAVTNIYNSVMQKKFQVNFLQKRK